MAATNFGQLWPSTWTTDGTLNAASVTAGSNSSNSGTIANYAASPNEVLDTECTVAVTYGGTVTGGGAIVYLCRRTGSAFESPTTDAPFSFTMPVTASTTCNKTFMVRGIDAADFQVVVNNPATNSTITVTLKSRQSQGQTG